MSKNAFNPTEANEILERIQKLTSNSVRQFGTMSVQGMVCHLADQLRVGFGEKTAKDRSSFLMRTLAKWLILKNVLKMPKGKTKTYPELAQEKGGTPPTDFEKDKQTLIRLFQKFLQTEDFTPHPIFGKLNKAEMGELTYIHFDHHLEQFGA